MATVSAVMRLSSAISHSIFEAIIFHLVSCKILLFFHPGELNHLTYSNPKNLCQPHFLVSSKIQNIRQHHFEVNKGLILYYSLSFIAHCRSSWKVNIYINIYIYIYIYTYTIYIRYTYIIYKVFQEIKISML